MRYFKTKTDSGEFTGSVTVEESELESNLHVFPDGTFPVTAIEGATPSTHYYDHESGLTVERPAMTATLDKQLIAADDTEVSTISGLPIPCTATVDGEITEVIDGEINFKTDFPGIYNVVVESFPYTPETFSVEAV